MSAARPHAPKRYFRPWNTDSMGEVIASSNAGITVRYLHDPQRTYFIGKHDAERVGRIVDHRPRNTSPAA